MVTRWDEKGKTHRDMEHIINHKSLKEALIMINNYNNGIEGKYPKEIRFGWVSLDSSLYKNSWKIIFPVKKVTKKPEEKKFDKLAEFLSRAPISFKDD